MLDAVNGTTANSNNKRARRRIPRRRRRVCGSGCTKRARMAARLLAGVRCHNRFYGALVASFENAYYVGNNCSLAASLVSEACGQIPLRGLSATVMFEVNMGARRPDCVCLLTRAGPDRICSRGSADAGKSVCLIVELKTCRFSRTLATETKKSQYDAGLRQLRDSAKMIDDLSVPGSDVLRIVPVLIFVAQRGMKIISVMRFKERTVLANVDLLRMRLSSLSAYARNFGPVSSRRDRDDGGRGSGGDYDGGEDVVDDDDAAATTSAESIEEEEDDEAVDVEEAGASETRETDDNGEEWGAGGFRIGGYATRYRTSLETGNVLALVSSALLGKTIRECSDCDKK